MSQALYRKWRPQNWDEVIAQDHVIQTLRNAVLAERTAHAYLFAGPRGTGKTSTARLLAKALNCEDTDPGRRPCNRCDHCVALQEGRFLDLIEIDAASNTSVEDVRDLRDKINFSPNEGRYKVYIIDEVHMLSTAAFNALLKTLEEPPEHAVFILATTEVHKIPATVLSRCQRHEFRRLPLDTMVSFLKKKAGEEGCDVEPGVFELIARQATGSMRDAISLLDQLASTGDRVTMAQAQAVLGTASSEAVRALIGAWVDGKPGRGLEIINRALDAGTDERQLARQMVDYFRGMLLVYLGNSDLLDVTDEQREEMEARMQAVSLDQVLRALQHFNQAASEKRGSWQRSLLLEMALIEATPIRPRGEHSEEPPSSGLSTASLSRKVLETGIVSPPDGEDDEEMPADGFESQPEAVQIGGPLSFEKVLDRWRDVLRAARSHDPQTQALLNSGKLLGLEDGALVIGFSNDLIREKMGRPEYIGRAGQALEDVFGEKLGIRCVLTAMWDSNHDVETDPVSMEDDGMVATALKDLGAQVVGIDDLTAGKNPAD
ncbi:MAG: DNA polymerase III subunit gamma/tau [Anaerolineales bacterium]|nr:DNA polymerase III subunit gamma/tau [Anaerolineales bacterium]